MSVCNTIEKEIITEVLQEMNVTTRQGLADLIEANISKVEMLQDWNDFDPYNPEHHNYASSIKLYSGFYRTLYAKEYLEDRHKLIETEVIYR